MGENKVKKRVKLNQWIAVVLSVVKLEVIMPQTAFASTKLSRKSEAASKPFLLLVRVERGMLRGGP